MKNNLKVDGTVPLFLKKKIFMIHTMFVTFNRKIHIKPLTPFPQVPTKTVGGNSYKLKHLFNTESMALACLYNVPLITRTPNVYKIRTA